MIFYDFEVFERDWLAVFIDVTNQKEHVIINDKDKLRTLYERNMSSIWVGFNNRHYDQYIMKTIKVFLENVDVFNAMHGIVQAFPEYVSLSDIGSSEARITAKVLGCTKQDFNDEFDYFFLPCLRLNKYKYVQDWFSTAVKDCTEEMKINYTKAKENYEKANSIKLKKKWNQNII